MSGHDPSGTAIWTGIERMVRDLRARGVSIGAGELLDAAHALAHVDLARRHDFRAALSCTLVKHAHHGETFAELFDRHFPARPPTGREPTRDSETAPAGPFEGRLEAALDARATGLDASTASDAELRLLAAEAVDAHAGLGEGTRTERYHVYRALRALDLAALLRAAMRRARAGSGDGDPPRSELERRIELLRRLVIEEVRARLAEHDERTSLAAPTDPFDVEIARATRHELEAMRRAVRPLARQLAARLNRRRRRVASGRVAVRQTVRRSLATGGVMLDVVHERRRVHKPEVFLLCDVSGSVADFAGFTLTFISALADELARTRIFAFVDAVDEITDLVRDSPGPIEPWQLLQRGTVIGPDGHSDYGAVLTTFWERYGRHGLTDRSTVIVTGDARSNYRPPGRAVLGEIAARARAVYWFNPEPRAEWDRTDSVMRDLARPCAAVFEVRTLRQLSAAVQQVL